MTNTPQSADPLPSAVPRYFGPADRPLFGWLHRPLPSAPARQVGVVICRPLGYEGLCSHRSMRHFAMAAAAEGFPTLRFDYDGTGDSAGGELASSRLHAWQASVDAAILALQETAGVAKVCLLGVRLGGMIATLVSAARSDVAGLALIAPVTAGASWLRELRALQATMGRADPPAGLTLPSGALESLGLLLTPETMSALKEIDLRAINRAPAPDCLVLDRDDRPPHEDWCAHLTQLGSRVVRHVTPGFVEMMLAPHESIVPDLMVAQFRSWMTATFGATAYRSEVPPLSDSLGPVPVAPGVTERAVFLDESRTLFGIATSPLGGQPHRTLIVMNSGAKHHIGNGGMYVTFARRLALKGWNVLRFDISGIGDSSPHHESQENDVYTPNAIMDLATAIHFARHQLGAQRVEVVGLCSGAYHSYKGAAAGLALDGVTIINPLVFDWQPGMSLSYPPYLMVQAVAQYKRSLLQASKWLHLVRGRVDVREIAGVLMHRALDRLRGLRRNIRREIGVSDTNDLGSALTGIVNRGVSVRFIFSAGDPGEALLRVGAGWTLTRLRRRGLVRIAHLPNCDHSLSAWWMRELLWEELLGGLDAP